MQELAPMTLEDKTDYREFISSVFVTKIESKLLENNISKYFIFIFFPSKLNTFPEDNTDEIP